MGPFLFLCKFYRLFPHPWYFLVFIQFYYINWLDGQKTKPAFVLTPHMVRYVPLCQKLGHGKICILAIFILLRVRTLYKCFLLVHNFLFLNTGNCFAEKTCNSQIILFLLPNINENSLLAFTISHLAAKPAYGIHTIMQIWMYTSWILRAWQANKLCYFTMVFATISKKWNTTILKYWCDRKFPS